MIKFFRHIRQSLLMEKPTSAQPGNSIKYFKYALGEIILVVIGILIALQINNWNEKQKSHKKEKALIHQLLEDLNQTYTDLEDIKAFYLARAKAATAISHSFWTGDHLKDTSLFYFNQITSYTTYNPVLGTAKSLVNSGNIDLVNSETVRKEIISFVEETTAQLSDIKRYEETYYRPAVPEFYSEFDTYNLLATYAKEDLQKRISNRMERNDGENLWPIPDEFDTPPFPEDLEAIYKNKKVYAAISNLIVAHRNTYAKYEVIQQKTEELINLLQAEGYD